MKLEFTKEDVIKIISLMQAIVDGKTIQAPNGNGGWIDVKEVLVNDLLYYYKSYRIKPEPKYNLELTTEELDIVKSSLSAFIISKINNSAQKLCRNILDDIDRIEEGCPDILCDDCTKECEMKKIMKQANEGLDLDKIADEVEQDIKEQSEDVTIASVWEKRDEVPFELKISEVYYKEKEGDRKMKDEEMAEEFLKKNNYTCGYIGYFASRYCKRAFLAGLKARPQWHDLRKNPKDLPEDTYDVLDQAGYKVHYNFFQNVWVNEKDEIDEHVIAWCEIPTFDKE